MKEVRETKIFVIKWSMIVMVTLCVATLIFFDARSSFGFFVGGMMSIINFNLLSLSLQKAVKFSPLKAKIYVFVNYIFRYILWFISFYIALKRPDVNLLTTIIGMLTVKLVILASNILNFSVQEKDNIGKEGN